MKKKGFTLIELLAVIVVLAIIAMIAVPTVLGIIDKAERGAFKSSVLGIIEAADFYRATNTINYGEDDIITFNCNGSECASDQGKLSFKGEVPKSGQIRMYKDGKVEAYYLQNKDYCARGERTNLDVRKDCNSLDTTEPNLEVSYIKSATNKIIIKVSTSDNESGIKKIRYEIEDRIIEDKYEELGSIEVNKEIGDLEPNKTYSIKITVINGNDRSSEATIEGTTLLVNSPGVNIEAEEVNASGYYINQVANIVYDDTNIENPEYFIKTTKNGVSSINIDAVCGGENEPTECTTIEETTTLESNKWYKVSGDLNVTYNELTTEIGTIYATIIYDGVNYITTTGVILKTTVEVGYKVNHHQMDIDGTNYTLKETEELTGYAYVDATPDIKEYEGFTSPNKQTINVLADGSSVVDYYYTRNQYTLEVNKGAGIASVSGAGTYRVGQSVTVGYTLSTGYHFSSWTGGKTTATFTMPSSNVTMQANGAANTYTIKYAANGGSGTMANTTCTYGSNCTLRANAFTKSGYAFNGWSGSNGGSYNNSVTVKNLTATNGATITMTANWKSVCSYSVGTTWSYDYTGGMQSFTVPCTGNYKLEVYGAAGSPSGGGGSGGYGGYSSGYIT